MKKLCFLFLVFTILACSEENQNTKDFNANQEFEFSAKNFVNSTIAYEKDDVVKLGVTDNDILTSFNEYSKKYELGSNANSYKIEKIGGSNYLRFHHEDGAVSTVALISKKRERIDDELVIIYKSGSTVCTTADCANCCDCIPDGSYCKLCQLNSDDCKRTTSGFQHGD